MSVYISTIVRNQTGDWRSDKAVYQDSGTGKQTQMVSREVNAGAVKGETGGKATPHPALTPSRRDYYPFYILVAMFLFASVFYYFGEIVNLAGWDALRWSFFYSVHDVHRLLFLAPIIYAAHIYRIRGAIVVTDAAFIVFLPRALFISPYPDPLLRMIIFVVGAGIFGVLTAAVRNETERRQQLESLLRSERDKLLGILDRMADGVIIVGPDYHVRFMNPSMVTEFGEGVGRHCYQQLYHGDQPCQSCHLPGVIAGATERWEYAFPDGGTYEVVASPFVDSDGVVCQLATYRNITQHKQAELELINLNRMKSELLSNISHELRSPLTSIKGVIGSLLQKNVKLDEATTSMLLSGVSEETDRLASLVTNLLNMSKLEAGVWQPEKARCHISDIINDAVEQQRWAHQKHAFQIEIAPGLPEFYADYSQLRQVVTNLLENASAFSEEDTPIVVRAKVVDHEIEVSVTDQGVGIPRQEVGKIFEKFYRGSQKRQRPGGTGLGLAICQAIVTAHGGRIWAESEVGRGSTFYFRLPIAPANT